MISIKNNNIAEIVPKINRTHVYLYGAGGNGRRIFSVLNELGVNIIGFCDDDFNKWGTLFCDKRVVSYDEILKMSETESISIVLTSVFAGPILRKLEEVNRIDVYEAFEFLIEKYYSESFYRKTLTYNEKQEFTLKIGQALSKLNIDNESREVLETIKKTVLIPDERRYDDFFYVASGYDCYFTKEVIDKLANKMNITIADCGGFTGDLMVALEHHNIQYSKTYSFEVNESLFAEMQENVKKNHLENKFIPVNKGVWSENGEMYFNFDDDDIAGGHITKAKSGRTSVKTVKLDDFFREQNTSVDFIKMDIEGAELPALKGAINIIKKDRPILAISLYHSVFDVVNIPLYLYKELDDYNFYIRHHSFIDSETVLYAIPC